MKIFAFVSPLLHQVFHVQNPQIWPGNTKSHFPKVQYDFSVILLIFQRPHLCTKNINLGVFPYYVLLKNIKTFKKIKLQKTIGEKIRKKRKLVAHKHELHDQCTYVIVLSSNLFTCCPCVLVTSFMPYYNCPNVFCRPAVRTSTSGTYFTLLSVTHLCIIETYMVSLHKLHLPLKQNQEPILLCTPMLYVLSQHPLFVTCSAGKNLVRAK